MTNSFYKTMGISIYDINKLFQTSPCIDEDTDILNEWLDPDSNCNHHANEYKKASLMIDDLTDDYYYTDFQFSLCEVEAISEKLKNLIDNYQTESASSEENSDTTIKDLQKLSNVFKKLCNAKVKEEYKTFDIYFFN
ncbi:MAG: hypothetical protein HRU36_04240 [Rickettsiales bacterium]|nr:hypothetical protein [Rickettsiales bacterium]